MRVHTANRLKTVEEYYFSIKLREVRGLIAAGKPVINMAIGSPDLNPPADVLESISQAVMLPGAHKYQSYQGLPELRNAIAEFYQTHYSVILDSEHEVLPLMGSKEGIMHISMAFLNPGDQVLIPNPGYPTYTSVTKLVEATPVFYALSEKNSWEPDFQYLEKMDLTKVKLMWVNYPHMPTGATGNARLFEKLVAFAKKHDILIINDNPYSFILNENPTSILSIPGAKEVALELNSLSKTFNMAGWRVGMLSGNASMIKEVLKVKSNMDSGMFFGIQKGAITALQSSTDWFVEMNAIYQKRRKLLWELADLLKCTFDKNATGMFVWAKLPEGSVPAEEFIDSLLYQHDLFVTPGTIFGTQGTGYIRFSLCVTENNIKKAIERLALKMD